MGQDGQENIHYFYYRGNTMLKKIIIICFCIGIVAQAGATSWPLQPFIIAGTISVNGSPVTSDTDDTYLLVVTNENLIPFSPAAEDRDGLREEYETYNISIPIYDKNRQPDGAVPGETAIINVYRNGSKLLVTKPWGGRIVVGNSSERAEINIETLTGPTDEGCENSVAAERRRWDANNDNRIGLEEAIRALQVVSGIRPNNNIDE